MKRKALAVIMTVLLALVVIIPRPTENRYYVKSIIDYQKGINVHYPTSINDKIDSDIYRFISKEIREHEESGKRNALLNISFDCYSSFFTVIIFKISIERENTTRSERLAKTRYKSFFTLSKGQEVSPIAPTLAYKEDNSKNIPAGKKLVALTFDDGPSEHTMSILNTLDSYGAKGTFCVLGTKVPSYRSTIEIMHAGGHEIANHTFNHQKLTSMKDDEMLKEVQKTQDAVYEITGEYPAFLRPTYGAINSKVRTNINMPLLMWNKDTMDWKSRNADYIFKQAVSNLKDGDIILFHDIYPSTAKAIEKIIPYFIDNGFCPVTVSELLSIRGIEAETGKAYFSSDDST